jgi:acyl-coenzyme A synthetase/AMP-(fatty) acid ligase
MNCSELFIQKAKSNPDLMAICIPGKENTTFQQLFNISQRAQALFIANQIQPGMSVLLVDSLGARLYASIIALLSMGVSIILVEPWMPIHRIEKIISLCAPKAFITHYYGLFWGMRIASVRRIQNRIQVHQIHSTSPSAKLQLIDVDPKTHAIITFTSGTTDAPKGVVRTHGYLIQQHEVLSRYLVQDRYRGADLCIFANFVLSNLAQGRTSVLIPSHWKPSYLRALDHLPQELQPETLTAGPAFLSHLMTHSRLAGLKSIHLGGALIDCGVFEKGFDYWPNADWHHIYGGSEVEPVAICDARQAVAQSKKRGFFQVLYLGSPIPEIAAQFENRTLWVAGPHVCPEYLGSPQDNRQLKRKDEKGILWHCMADRIVSDEAGWWFKGRSNQLEEDFELEQKIYQKLSNSACFIHRTPSSTSRSSIVKWLVGENLNIHREFIRKQFPEILDVLDTKIYRDVRHRSRLDRAKTLKKGPSWLKLRNGEFISESASL